MPKHRSTVYTVVRESSSLIDGEYSGPMIEWGFSGLVGTYVSLQRADEVAAATIQEYLDKGMDPTFPDYRCSVKPSTYYEE